MADTRARRLYTCVSRLKLIGPTSPAVYKFILDSTPFDGDNDSLPPTSEEWTIKGRLLPNSDIFKDGAINVDIKIGTTYPIDPPKVVLKTPIFHPNVNSKGDMSIAILRKDGEWKAVTTLVSVIETITKTIDTPSLDYPINPEAAALYSANIQEYERVAREKFRKDCASRT